MRSVARALLFGAACVVAAVSPASAETVVDYTAANYNVFVLGDYTAGSTDVQGRLAVGGNATFNGFGAGTTSQTSFTGQDSVVVGGKLTAANGQVHSGNVVAGSLALSSNFSVPAPGTVRTGSVAGGIATEGLRLKNISSTLAATTATGTTTVQSWGGLSFSGTNSDVNYFSLAGSDLARANSFVVDVPTGSIAIFNISGIADQMKNFGFSLTGATASTVLLNFYEATSLAISGIGVKGTVLAPNAAVDFANGNIDGTLIAGSLSGGGESHYVPFAGTQLAAAASPPAVPEPAAWAMMIAGFGLVGAAMRRNRRMMPALA